MHKKVELWLGEGKRSEFYSYVGKEMRWIDGDYD